MSSVVIGNLIELHPTQGLFQSVDEQMCCVLIEWKIRDDQNGITVPQVAVNQVEVVSASSWTMAARPPSARPHIGLHPSFNARSTDWGEDDAWDSASDSESPRQSTIAHSWRPTLARSTTAPKPVPRTSNNSSSSTLALSYTHVSAPSPSSYPPKADSSPGPPSKGGWTMVRKLSPSPGNADGELPNHDVHGDTDLDADMVIGDFEPEVEPVVGTKAKPLRGSLRPDAEELVNGITITSMSLLSSQALW